MQAPPPDLLGHPAEGAQAPGMSDKPSNEPCGFFGVHLLSPDVTTKNAYARLQWV